MISYSITFGNLLERVDAGLDDGEEFALLDRLRYVGQHVPDPGEPLLTAQLKICWKKNRSRKNKR